MKDTLKIDYSFLVSLFCLLFFVFIMIGQGTVQSSDGINLLSLTKSIVENGSLAIEEGINGWNAFTVGADGRQYSKYPPGTSILLIPFYFSAKILAWVFNKDIAMGIGLTGTIFTAFVSAMIGIVLFIWSTELRVSVKKSVFTVFAYSFLTMNLFQSKELYSHSLVTLFLLLSCYFIYIKSNFRRDAFLGAFIFGLAIVTRFESIILIPFLSIYIWFIHSNVATERLRKLIYFLCFASISIGVMLLYNHYRYGVFFSTGGYVAMEKISIGNFVEGFYLLLFSTGRGLFLFNPIIIIPVLFCVDFFDRKREFMFLFLLVVIPLIVFYSTVRSVAWVGFSWGPRHLLTILPFLIIPIAQLNICEMKGVKKLAFFLVLAISFAIQLASISVNPSRYYHEMKKKHHEDFIVAANYNVKESILFQQWNYIASISKQLQDEGFRKKMRDSIQNRGTGRTGSADILTNNISLNVFNFWWVYMYFVGFSAYLIGGVVLMLVSIAAYSGFRVYRSVTAGTC